MVVDPEVAPCVALAPWVVCRGALLERLLEEDVRVVLGGGGGICPGFAEALDSMSVIDRRSRSTMPTDVAPRDDFRVQVVGTRVTGYATGSCRVVTTQRLGPGERGRVPVSVALPSTSRNISQDRSVTLSMRVHLVEGRPGDPCGEGEPGVGPTSDEGDGSSPERPGRVETGDGRWEVPAST